VQHDEFIIILVLVSVIFLFRKVKHVE